MKQFVLLAFISAFLIWDITTSKVHRFPSHRARLVIGSKNEEENESKEEKRIVCKTQECNRTAEYLLNSMNKSVDPCTDFYEYACGNWPKHFPAVDYLLWSPLFVIQTKIEQEIKEILETGPEKNDLFAVKLAKRWYLTCKDTDAMDKQGLAPLIATLSRIGGWPMIMEPEEWNEQEYSWQKVDDHYMRLTGRNSLHDLQVVTIADELDILKQIPEVHIFPPSLPPGVYEMMSQENDNDYDDDDEDNDDDDDGDSDDDNDDDDGDDDNNDDSDDDDDDDDSDDDNDDDNNDNDDTDTNESNAKKIGKKLSTNKKIRSHKNIKFGQNEKKKNGIHITKKNNYKIKRQRTKRGTSLTRNKRAQHFAHRRIHNRKIKQNEKRDERKGTKIVLDKKRPSSRAFRKNTNNKNTIEEQTKKYAYYILEVARALAKEANVEVSQERLESDIQNVVEFQFKLTDLAMKPSETVNMTLDTFQEWYDEKNSKTANSKINWVYKVAKAFYEAGVSIDADLRLTVTSPDYFEALVSLLDETPSRTIVNYIHWNFVSRMLRTTTNEMRILHKMMSSNNTLSLSECDNEMNMSAIVGYEYVRRYFSDEVMQIARDMFDDIQKEVEYRIKEAEWMDDDTKDLVLSKLVNIGATIGYPKWFKNDTLVKRYFQGLILSNSYYENTLSFDRYFRWAMLRQITTVARLDVEIAMNDAVPTSIVGGGYHPLLNYLVIPSADFRSPLFDLNRPPAVNYGFIGWIMAHEVNHGFDSTGHRFDKTGKNKEWLSTMAEAYGKRAECFVEQFNNYPVDKTDGNLTLPDYGNQTIDDNIADTMGLQAAYKAYQRRERECEGSDVALPGLEELTNDQLFFLSSANLWCEATNPEVDEALLILLAASGDHSTNRLRVIGSLSNSEDFARAYNCPIGSPMNPTKKCNIWK